MEQRQITMGLYLADIKQLTASCTTGCRRQLRLDVKTTAITSLSEPVSYTKITGFLHNMYVIIYYCTTYNYTGLSDP